MTPPMSSRNETGLAKITQKAIERNGGGDSPATEDPVRQLGPESLLGLGQVGIELRLTPRLGGLRCLLGVLTCTALGAAGCAVSMAAGVLAARLGTVRRFGF